MRGSKPVRPWDSSQRGDSGKLSRRYQTMSAPMPAITNIGRQPRVGMITRAPERRPPPENHLPMMPYRMRTATPADAPFILSLHALPHVAAVLSAPTEEQVLGAMESPDLGNHLVVDGADAPVGLLLLAESTSWLYEVRRMAARDQGRGIGSFALAWRSTKAWCTNARARGLYEAQGFVHEGTWREGARSDDDGRYEDLCAYGILEREYRARSGC